MVVLRVAVVVEVVGDLIGVADFACTRVVVVALGR